MEGTGATNHLHVLSIRGYNIYDSRYPRLKSLVNDAASYPCLLACRDDAEKCNMGPVCESVLHIAVHTLMLQKTSYTGDDDSHSF